MKEPLVLEFLGLDEKPSYSESDLESAIIDKLQMYVNHFDRHVKTPGENPTIGILLCKRKKEALIRLTLPKDANIFASRYQLYLPSKEDLRRRLLEWTRDEHLPGPLNA